MAHREASLAVLAGALTLLVVTWRRERAPGWLVGAAAAAAGLTLVQITVGVVLAYLDLPRGAQVAHLAAASLLLGAETLVALLAYRLPEGAA